LADIFGNLINRTFTFVHKHFGGEVPARSNIEKIDKEIIELAKSYPKKISDLFENYKFKDGVLEIMNLARAGNKYFNDSEPWKTIKSDKEKCGTTINICLNVIYTLAELFYPILPFSMGKLFKMLNSSPTNWIESGKENMKTGHKLNDSEILFPKIEDDIIEKQISKLKGANMNEVSTESELISFEEFMKVQLKVAEVISAERVEKSEKLLKLKIALENEERQIIAGIAKSYAPENLIGKKVIIAANLKPVKLMGFESRGMILAVENEDGKHEVIMVDSNIKNGTQVK
jgi:methionyl-tRNA synthetase